MTIPYPRISPVLFHIGPLQVRWYGLMYLVGYVVGYRIALRRVRRGLVAMTEADLDSLIGYFVVGMLVGARLVYAIVYQPGHFLDQPLEFFRVWHGGLSFHGAMLGMTAACLVFARVHRVRFWQLADLLAFAGTPGLFFGRLGNFINEELYGRPTHLPWAMVFPSDPLHLPRHPSQLYEAIGEGILVFLALVVLQRWSLRRGWYRPGLLGAAFLILYGVVRFLIEFTREPDAQLGLVLGPFSMGQVLCAGMVLAGAAIAAWLYRGGGVDPPRDVAG
jgi:phosphatidylglycerol:prolipoprotein diacylglycerol transferase